MQEQISSDREFEWLDHVQPIGLVLARRLLKSLSLNPERQTKADEDAVNELLSGKEAGPALQEPWLLFERVLGWNVRNVAGVPDGEPLPPELNVRLPEYDTNLSPTWAVRGVKGEADWQLLVRIEDAGIEPDKRGVLDGWEATPHQRFERLLRETQVHAGVLLTDNELRLIYAPRGETSGWIPFPLRPLGTVAGRPMLGGLKLVLGSFRLFNDAKERRLPALLRDSREAQATVSTNLSAQVLGALHELLRGLHAADPKLISNLAEKNPQHLYEGLLSVLMRLVFILYAEDRDLIPSKTDERSRAFYQRGYSVRGLFAKLLENEARYPDTMNERVGGWGRLIALFRLVHGGHKSDWIKGRGGKLFDPKEFPFLEGRAKPDDAPRILTVSDGTLLRILRGLMVVDGERLSYRTLDVEQIGSVYETVMGFTVEQSSGPSLAIKAGKNNKVPVFVDLDALLPLKPADRIKRIKEDTGRKLTGQAETKIKQAKSVAELAAAIDGIIDERGSPMRRKIAQGTPILQPTDERRRTGSHYTPRSLTEPIVRHALEPAFERIGPDAKPEDVLLLKVCDPAMGSGAFLVEACRMLAARLVMAWGRWPAQRPTIPPDEDDELHARRLVAQRCLYGVDKNPMATDLAKLSLWLATLARDHEFTFVDHALRTGDSLVGLSLDQIAATHWDENQAPTFAGQFVKALLQRASAMRAEIQKRGESASEVELRKLLDSVDAITEGARLIGDGIVSCFFAEDKPRMRIAKLVEFQKLVLSHLGKPDWIDLAVPHARALEKGVHPIRPFHWQLEFPEVFEGKNRGFDAIVGNPPFLGGTNISTNLGKAYVEYLVSMHSGTGDRADLVAYFFRAAMLHMKDGAVLGFVATNTIGQGDTRKASLAHIQANGGSIIRATSRLRWPGEAAVVVSTVHIRRGPPNAIIVLNGNPVKRISAYLVAGENDSDPSRLAMNASQSAEGMVPYGDGFRLRDDEVNRLPTAELGAVFPFIGGKHFNTDPSISPECSIAYLVSENLETAQREYPQILSLLEERVKPDRESRSEDVARAPWWLFWRPRKPLFTALERLGGGYARSKVATHHAVARLPHPVIPDVTLVVFPGLGAGRFSILQSRVHEIWARFFASSMKDDLRYTPSDCYATFPFPSDFDGNGALNTAGQTYHDYRAKLMAARNEGLTKTYNRFNSANERSADIAVLRELHDAMDQAVLAAYGWADVAEVARPIFEPEFAEEQTGKNKKAKHRLRWPAPVRDEVLARLLALNAERAEHERQTGIASILTDEDISDLPESDEDEYDQDDDEAA